MRRLWTALLIAGLGAAYLLTAESSAQQTDQALRALVPKIVASWETMDFAKIEPFYAADADLTYFDLAPLKYNNWAEYRAGVQKAFFEPNASIKAKVNDDLRVHSHGSFAWATFTWSADLTSKKGETAHMEARWSMVLEKRAKGWIIVHEHVSAPLPTS